MGVQVSAETPRLNVLARNAERSFRRHEPSRGVLRLPACETNVSLELVKKEMSEFGSIVRGVQML